MTERILQYAVIIGACVDEQAHICFVVLNIRVCKGPGHSANFLTGGSINLCPGSNHRSRSMRLDGSQKRFGFVLALEAATLTHPEIFVFDAFCPLTPFFDPLKE